MIDEANEGIWAYIRAYPYDLGYHTASGQLCRLPRFKGQIPTGCVRIKRYRERHPATGEVLQRWINPYVGETGELKFQYWSLYLARDLERGDRP